MTINDATPTSPTPGTAGPTTPTTPTTAARPVFRVEIGKKKRKYSRGLKTAQEYQRGMLRGTARLARAFAEGATTFYRRSDASARKKRDGAIKDALDNWARATSKAMKRASFLPRDLVAPLNTKRNRRRMRNLARLFLNPFGSRR